MAAAEQLVMGIQVIQVMVVVVEMAAVVELEEVRGSELLNRVLAVVLEAQEEIPEIQVEMAAAQVVAAVEALAVVMVVMVDHHKTLLTKNLHNQVVVEEVEQAAVVPVQPEAQVTLEHQIQEQKDNQQLLVHHQQLLLPHKHHIQFRFHLQDL